MNDRTSDLRKAACRLPENSVISIVDDDESIREAIRSLFRSIGFTAAVFPSAEDFLQSSRVADTACLILDVRMPGMDGSDLHRRLIAAGSRIPVIFISAHGGEDARAAALLDGAIEFLPKPFSEDALLSAVYDALTQEKR